MSKILCFIYNDMADFELTMATTAVSWLKMDVVTIAYTNETVTARPGLQYQPHMTVKDAINLEDVAGIIIPGGWNSEQQPELIELITKLYSDDKLVSAICAGPQFLAHAGVLNNRKYTTTWTEDHLKEQGIEDFFPRENYVIQNVVRDQNVVTAVGHAFIDFAMEIIDYFDAFKDDEMKHNFSKHYKGLD
ncbi:DJ-1/PfpI family protein [Haloplasma contractile]|uniref:ThiJ-pfpI family protein n=1 Tax=Haloplasma contractile SSD-17B TaxID=1033810 RepID=F7PVQ5_9MOLU|nr:DJ-1/PfpI family protein [Haloplasma contractile]ERJ12774.1 ThiJ-pfpI family protein [Haloplasma contractile SSD-17B]